MAISGNVVLCSTPRLARSFALEQARIRRDGGAALWQPARISTLAQWLDETLSRAMLAGELPTDFLPNKTLDASGERVLWERAIEKNTRDETAQALFDMAGLARTAAEAHRLMVVWNVEPPSGWQSEETRRFLQWRETFLALCRQHHALDSASAFERQIVALQRGAGRLPDALQLVGFDRLSPQEKRLLDALKKRGVAIEIGSPVLAQAGDARQIACDDIAAECRAAVGWAAEYLKRDSTARIAIVAPELGVLRARLLALLDDALHPLAALPSQVEMPRLYDFSLGDPLASHPLIACGVNVLRLAARRFRIPQQDAGRLLRDVHWSAGLSEADARARLDAVMRAHLPASIHLEQWLRLARKALADGANLHKLVAHLEAISACDWPRKQTARAWADAFADLLQTAGWPGERALSSHEYQAMQAWNAALEDFAKLDELLPALDAGSALRRFSALLRERIFQPETEGEPRVWVMGMLETPAFPLDAIWVLGMNDHQWPPPPRPNPLLPAEAQRHVGAPNACGRVQAEFAQTIETRLLHSAPEIIFSYSRRDGERELRASPALTDLAALENVPDSSAPLAEKLALPATMEWLDDHRAPPLAAGEKLGGGTSLLKAQAICPAWAFYRHRLGARELGEPVDGLDAMGRGNLLHLVMQAFWQGHDSTWLQNLDEENLQTAIIAAVEQGMKEFDRRHDAPLPTQFAALEKLRLQRLLALWLDLEKTRPPFAVAECEQHVELEIEGLRVTLMLDRVDALPDGRRVVIDYKTGAHVTQRSWAEDRITEPQLPVYAALALREPREREIREPLSLDERGAGERVNAETGEPFLFADAPPLPHPSPTRGEGLEKVAAVCFAKLHSTEQKFVGIAAEDDLLPGVTGLDAARKMFPPERFPDWAALMEHWRVSISAIAMEIRAGDAAVRFRDENDLRDCEVKPLLRLPERALQLERPRGASNLKEQ